MSMVEWWWLYDVKCPKDKSGHATSLTDDEIQELLKMMDDY